MDAVDNIDQVYESMKINKSIIVCDSAPELAFMIDALESRSYPCRYVCSTKKEALQDKSEPNKMFVCITKEFNSAEFWEILEDIPIECIFFLGQNVFSECLPKLMQQSPENTAARQFIFTIN